MEITPASPDALTPNVTEILANLKPELPVPANSPLYVDLDRVRGGSPAEILANVIVDHERRELGHRPPVRREGD